MQRLALTLLAIVFLPSCAGPVGVDPRLSFRERDELQRAMPRPPLDDGSRHESVTAEVMLAIPRSDLSAWFDREGKNAWSESRAATRAIAGVVRTEVLTGAFTQLGDRRRIVYSDGNTAVEELVAGGPETIARYEVWNDTRSIARYWRYATGELVLADHGSGTQLRWTCRFRPKGWPDGYLISDHVHRDYRAFMQASLERVASRATAELGSR